MIEAHQAGEQRSSVAAEAKTSLHGRALIVARTLWTLIALFELGTLLYSVPSFISQQLTVCTDLTHVRCGYYQLITPQLAALQHLNLSFNVYAVYALSLDAFVTLLLLAFGGLIFWHRSADRMGLFVSLLFITIGCFGVSDVHIGALPTVPPVIEFIGTILSFLMWPAIGILFYTFPDGRFVPRWSWLLAALFIIQIGFYYLPYPYDIDHWPPLLSVLELLLVYGSAVGTLVYRYIAVATPLQRQQIKWLAFGFTFTILLGAAFPLLPLIFPVLNAPDSPYQLSNPFTRVLVNGSIPLGVGMALLRYRLWDIDTLINRALIYGLLTAILVSIYALLVFGGQSLLTRAIGNSDSFVIVASTLIIAILFQPLRKRLQALVDRRFYRKKYDAARTLSAFSATLHNEVDLPQLQEQLTGVIEETMLPSHISLWLCPPQRHSHIPTTHD